MHGPSYLSARIDWGAPTGVAHHCVWSDDWSAMTAAHPTTLLERLAARAKVPVAVNFQ